MPNDSVNFLLHVDVNALVNITVGVCIATKAFQVDDVFIGVVQAQRGVDGVEVVFGFKVE